MSDIKRIIVTIEGGVVTAVIAETIDGTHAHFPLIMVDYDTEGSVPSELTSIQQGEGHSVGAYVSHWWTDTSDAAFPAHRDPREG